MEYYLRNDRKYTQAEKEEYKRLKAEKEKEILENDEWQKGDWEYEWNADGSLKSVKLPDGENVIFEYDALGRRTKKIFNNKIIRYLWDGNVLLHEWEYDVNDEPKRIVNNLGEISYDKKEPVNNLTTWVYESGSFVPIAKLIGNECFSIVSDYIGRPIQAFDSLGNLIWQTEYDIYGSIKNLKGEKDFIPFRQLGQYEDVETGLYYNRFRYYDCNTGTYISKDPISIFGGLNVYAYVKDVNSWIDVFGLKCNLKKNAKELLAGNDVIVSSFKEANELLKYAFPNAKKVTGASPVGVKLSDKIKTFKLDNDRIPVFKKDYLKDKNGIIYGHYKLPDGHIHKTNPHINILTSEGLKVSINIIFK